MSIRHTYILICTYTRWRIRSIPRKKMDSHHASKKWSNFTTCKRHQDFDLFFIRELRWFLYRGGKEDYSSPFLDFIHQSDVMAGNSTPRQHRSNLRGVIIIWNSWWNNTHVAIVSIGKFRDDMLLVACTENNKIPTLVWPIWNSHLSIWIIGSSR